MRGAEQEHMRGSTQTLAHWETASWIGCAAAEVANAAPNRLFATGSTGCSTHFIRAAASPVSSKSFSHPSPALLRLKSDRGKAINIQDSKSRVQATVLMVYTMGKKRAGKQAGLALLNVYLPTQGDGNEREKADRGELVQVIKGPNPNLKKAGLPYLADGGPQLR